MTKELRPRAALLVEVNNLRTQLDQARADAKLYRRLKAAEAEEKRFAAELVRAEQELHDVQAREDEAERDERFAGFHDITVTTVGGDHVLIRGYQIAVTQDQYDSWGTSRQTLTFSGFRAVPSEALAYLIEKHPDRIPPEIAELAPGDPWAAFGTYFVGLRRGYLNKVAA